MSCVQAWSHEHDPCLALPTLASLQLPWCTAAAALTHASCTACLQSTPGPAQHVCKVHRVLHSMSAKYTGSCTACLQSTPGPAQHVCKVHRVLHSMSAKYTGSCTACLQSTPGPAQLPLPQSHLLQPVPAQRPLTVCVDRPPPDSSPPDNSIPAHTPPPPPKKKRSPPPPPTPR